jgi:hypothetical protein
MGFSGRDYCGSKDGASLRADRRRDTIACLADSRAEWRM